MALISVSDGFAKKSFTSVENKFITKYMPVLDPVAVKVYLFALYILNNGLTSYTLEDLATRLSITSDEAKNYFEYLEEFELVSIISHSPFEVKILEAENDYGTPKKYKPEKYADFTKNVQNIIKGRMISTNEFREYFALMEDYGFEQNALIMIINYCVNLKGDNIRVQYIKKVAKSFAEEGVTTVKKVDDKLSAYTSSTPALIKIFSAAGINRQPDFEDDKFYKKWTSELGFEDNAIIAASRHFKAKTPEKLDSALTELYKNKKFDIKEIEDYCKNKNSVNLATADIARTLGVYMQNSAPYVENYVNVWYDYGYSFECMKFIASFCFRHNLKSFEDMHEFVQKLYNDGIVNDESVGEHIKNCDAEDAFIKKILSYCGLTRKIITWDRECLTKWKSWNFSEDMILEAAKLSAGKSNPMAYMNSILSSWKAEGVISPDKIERHNVQSSAAENRISRAEIERHYYDLRHMAEDFAERALKRALSDEAYAKIHKKINELSIDLAFAELRDVNESKRIAKQISQLEADGDIRLKELNIDKADFTPKYSCKNCNDTGYDKQGKQCQCLKKFISSL